VLARLKPVCISSPNKAYRLTASYTGDANQLVKLYSQLITEIVMGMRRFSVYDSAQTTVEL